MAIGRKFEEAFQKALRMTDENILGFDPDTEFTVCDKVIMQQFMKLGNYTQILLDMYYMQ